LNLFELIKILKMSVDINRIAKSDESSNIQHRDKASHVTKTTKSYETLSKNI